MGTKLQKTISACVLAFLSLVILTRIPVSIDYEHYMLATRGWLAGTTELYDVKAGEFYYLPWALWITVPLSLMPEWLGQAILNLISLASIAWVCHLWVGELKVWQWLVVFVNLFTINLLFTAQWDGLTLLGLGLAWWSLQKRSMWGVGLGLMLAATKPVNIILPMSLLCWYTLHTVKVKQILQALIAPVILIAWSFGACGMDWPFRYLRYIFATSPPAVYNNSLWKEPIPGPFLWILLIGLIVFILFWMIFLIKKKKPVEAIILGLAGNLVLSPYVMTYHFIVTSPALAYISKRNWPLSLVIYGLMLWILLGVARILPLPSFILYPVVILAGQAALTALPMRQAFSSE